MRHFAKPRIDDYKSNNRTGQMDELVEVIKVVWRISNYVAESNEIF